MKRILLIIIITLLLSGCCENKRLVPTRVVDKYITSNKDGYITYFHLLLSNGDEKDVDGKEYANTKIGDTYYANVCMDDYK